MIYSGTVIQGKIVFETDPHLPDGTHVEVQVAEPALPSNALRHQLLKLAGVLDDLPSDMARNHDRYIHGAVQA
jgi:hypothetical protein